MKSRMSTIALAWGVMIFLTFNNLIRPFDNIFDVFCWLSYLLIIALIVMWPKTGKDRRGEVIANTWSDRIDFDAPSGRN